MSESPFRIPEAARAALEARSAQEEAERAFCAEHGIPFCEEHRREHTRTLEGGFACESCGREEPGAEPEQAQLFAARNDPQTGETRIDL